MAQYVVHKQLRQSLWSVAWMFLIYTSWRFRGQWQRVSEPRIAHHFQPFAIFSKRDRQSAVYKNSEQETVKNKGTNQHDRQHFH